MNRTFRQAGALTLSSFIAKFISLSAFGLVLFVTQPAISSESASYKFGESTIPFTYLPDQGITISSSCIVGTKLKKCQASEELRKANMKKMPPDPFGRNPGALICSEQVGGHVAWSRDPRGNERTFCKFGDGPMVTSGTLAFFGRENAKKGAKK